MDDFLMELTLALKEFFCGEIIQKNNCIMINLDDGQNFILECKAA